MEGCEGNVSTALSIAGGWAIPGQAQPIGRGPSDGRPRTGTLRAAAGGAVPVNPSGSGGTKAQSPASSAANLAAATSDEDDDFFDAQDDSEGFEFDVTLPSKVSTAPSTATTTPTTAATAAVTMATGRSGEGGSSASGSASAASLPIGADLAMEYESDIGDSDIGEDDALEGEEGETKARRKKPLKQEARVIQKHGWGKAR